jgi:hypothetical protein
VLVVADDALLMRCHEHDAQGDREDQAVQGADENQDLDRAADKGEDSRGEDDEGNDQGAVVAVQDRAEGPDEGHGSVGGADDGADRGSPHDDAEDLIAHIACRQFEDRCRRVGRIQGHAGSQDAEGRQEEDDAHDARNTDARNGTARDFAQMFHARDAGVDEAVAAAEGDVAADRAANQGDDGHHVDFIRHYGLGNDLAHGRRRRNRHVEGEDDHDEPGQLGELVHRPAGFLHHEDGDGDAGADGRADNRIDAEEDIEAQAGAADVADVEGQAAHDDEQGDEIPQAGQHLIGDILAAQAGHADDAPDIQLRPDVKEHAQEDDEAEARPQLARENRRLGQEARADGTGRHQERGAHEQTHVEFHVLSRNRGTRFLQFRCCRCHSTHPLECKHKNISDRPDLDALLLQGGPDTARERQGFRPVSVDTDGIGLYGNFRTCQGLHGPFLHHAQDLGQGLLLVGNHGAGLAAGRQPAVRLVRAVREDFARRTQACLLSGLDQLAAGQTEEDQIRIEFVNRFRNATGQGRVFRRHVVQCPVGLHMVHHAAFGLDDAIQGADLIQRDVVSLFARNIHFAPAEAFQILQARMGAQGDAIGQGEADGLLHDRRVPGVETAGNVRRRNVLQHLVVAPDSVSAEAFAQVAVQIYAGHILSSFSCPIERINSTKKGALPFGKAPLLAYKRIVDLQFLS